MFREIKFNPLTISALPPLGYSADTTSTCSDGPPFVCMLCPPGTSSATSAASTFPHKVKLITHLVLNHRQPFCSVCCSVLATEQDRMTHENRTHWPFRCAHCRREFFQAAHRECHQREAHRRRTCDLCEVRCPADEVAGGEEYDQHLRVQHDCLSSDFGLAIVAVVATAAAKPIAKFNCRLCAKEKLFANFAGHFLNYHKVRLNKFLALTLQFMDTNEEFLHRIGAAEKDKDAPEGWAGQKAVAGGKSAFAEVAAQFNVTLREEYRGAVVTKRDFEAELVQFVGSTDEEASSAEEDGGELEEEREEDAAVGRRRQLLRCVYCESPARFDRVGLGKHLQTQHGFHVRNLEWRCHRCRRPFASRVALQRHRQKMHAADCAERTAGRKCTFCEQQFESRKTLRIHIRQHIDRHDYPCPPDRLAHCCRFCPELFWTIDQKNAHQNARHTMQMPADELLLCGHCGITSSSKSFLTIHTAEAHASLTQLTPFVFKCAACLIAHTSLDDLRAHMRLVHPAQLADYCAIDECRARIAAAVKSEVKTEATDEATATAEMTPTEVHMRGQHSDRYQYECRRCGHRVLSKQGALKHFHSKHGLGVAQL